MATFSKKDTDLIKTLYEQKEYNAGQSVTIFPNKSWTKSMLLLRMRKYGTVDSSCANENDDTTELPYYELRFCHVLKCSNFTDCVDELYRTANTWHSDDTQNVWWRNMKLVQYTCKVVSICDGHLSTSMTSSAEPHVWRCHDNLVTIHVLLHQCKLNSWPAVVGK